MQRTHTETHTRPTVTMHHGMDMIPTPTHSAPKPHIATHTKTRNNLDENCFHSKVSFFGFPFSPFPCRRTRCHTNAIIQLMRSDRSEIAVFRRFARDKWNRCRRWQERESERKCKIELKMSLFQQKRRRERHIIICDVFRLNSAPRSEKPRGREWEWMEKNEFCRTQWEVGNIVNICL